MIHDLKRQGLSVSAIARQVGLDRKTVRKHLSGGVKVPVYRPREPRPAMLEPFEPYLRERTTAYPELSGKRLLREIREMGYRGGYTMLTDFLRDVRPARHRPFERRFETPAGRQAQVDFAQFKVGFTDEPGVSRIVWLSAWCWGTVAGCGAAFARHRICRRSCGATSMRSLRSAGRRRKCFTIA